MTVAPDSQVPRHAALVKLARVLDVDDAELTFLAPLDVAALQALRDRCAAVLHEADAERLGAVASAGRLLPNGISASIAQRFFGPTLVSRLVGLMDPERAAQQGQHMATDFMADVAARADPRVISNLAEHLELRTLQDITKVLIERDDVVTLSLFVGPLPPQTIADILEVVDDHAAVVRIAQYVEDVDALDPIVARLPDDRIRSLLEAVRDGELWDEAAYLFEQLNEPQISRLGTIARTVDDLPGALQTSLGLGAG